ncbi:hypothetical protein [Micromonospora sp. NPDC047730]|uniref:hypothetical protein n=1 Tax=Micromonospora sp. NPDC047730 TaxID=3364253 RepID=UPI00371F7BD9
MGVPVTKLQLTPLDDGRQELLIQFGHDEQPTTVIWYGHLEADFLPAHDTALQFDLTMKVRPGGFGREWARVTCQAPSLDEALDLGRPERR